MKRYVAFFTAVIIAGCSGSRTSNGGPDHGDLSPVIHVGPADFQYVASEEVDADHVVVIEILIPVVETPQVFRFPLRYNANATVPGIQKWVSCRRACGGPLGCGGSVSIDGQGAANDVVLRISVNWNDTTRRDGAGEAVGEIRVAWLGNAEIQLQNGASARAYFDPIR